MNKLIITILLVPYSLCLFPKHQVPFEKLDSKSLFPLEKKELSNDIVASNFNQVRNAVNRYEGHPATYYSLGVYKHIKTHSKYFSSLMDISL